MQSILVVQLDHMGDAVLSSGMLAALRKRYPDARIDVLAGAWNRALFEAMPEVDRVFASRVNRFSRAGRLGWAMATCWWGWRLRRERYDLGIDVRGEFPLALLLWLAGARRRLGWAAGGGGFLLTDSAAYVPDRPEVESRRALLAQLGIEAVEDDVRPRLRPPVAARRTVDKLLAESNVAAPFLVLHVSAGTPAKQWPIEHWRELLGRLILRGGRELVLVGSRADRIIARRILEGRDWPGARDWTGRLGVMELAALLERAAALVGADSGPAHLAAAVDTPVVALFSGTNCPEQWQPVGRGVTVLRHDAPCRPCHREVCPVAGHPCMRGLLPEAVARAVDEALQYEVDFTELGRASDGCHHGMDLP
ncbi:MAG: lipopolysaccharide heptosyltransferase II [Pirellulales bacterium]|nr:lipopolysaccharide heptosyltransferase II [Pirellulales bacterium]